MNNMIRSVVVGVAEMHDQDPGMPPSGEDPVLASAVALAERLGARLHAVRAFERPTPVLSAYTHASDNGTALQNGTARIERCPWAQTRRSPLGDRIHCHAVEGRADLQLCAFAEEIEADLLIVGATRRGHVLHDMLGSTAEQVVRRATVPVLVIHHPFDRPVHRILLATDLSELGPAIYEVALDTVEAAFGDEPLEARTLLVCHNNLATTARMSQEFTTRTATSKLRQFLAERLHRRLPVSARIRLGNPTTEIIREAGEWKADLLVLGSQSYRGIPRLFLGSTAAATIRASSCNVLVIPAPVAASWHQRQEGNRSRPRPHPAFLATEVHADARPTLTTI
jgi:nucleotide-binding universal stress UspA family protein